MTLSLLSHTHIFGHSLAASGLAGLVTTALALQSRSVPADRLVTQPLAQLSERLDLMLAMDSVICFAPASEIVGSMSGTSFSGDDLHIVACHDTRHRVLIKCRKKHVTSETAHENRAV